MRFLLFGCVLTCVEVWTFISSAGISFTKYHYDLNLAGYRCVPHKTVFETDNVSDPVQCVKQCHLTKKCRSVFYQPDSNKCIGCRNNPDIQTANLKTCNGSQYIRSKPVYTEETDCKAILKDRRSAPSGIYKIRLWKSKKIISVFCDMDTDGGGWTTIHTRFDGSTDFNRSFSEYENGFGAVNGEYWLGLKYIQELADKGTNEIRLEVTSKQDEDYFENYKDFKLLNGSDYVLSINPDTAESYPVLTNGFLAFAYLKGYPFSTFDRDMDAWKDNCARLERGGWWYRDCGSMNLNGEFCEYSCDHKTYSVEIGYYVYGFADSKQLKTSRMLIRRYAK
ncbi:microfibril-associated glycoprotein 4-like isoform X1 [Mercenaria mercenaria]|uniref:microfibril-associated glycoprotein 4-like isoform X1 n=2 Tax=Mercenaria mercenaria TaxID=6596 RepID=UPI00234F5A54|nr:microfibril-associated glycoprotein 4-like isoform X1 [Mercenaria mercenaria]